VPASAVMPYSFLSIDELYNGRKKFSKNLKSALPSDAETTVTCGDIAVCLLAELSDLVTLNL